MCELYLFTLEVLVYVLYFLPFYLQLPINELYSKHNIAIMKNFESEFSIVIYVLKSSKYKDSNFPHYVCMYSESSLKIISCMKLNFVAAHIEG